MQLSHPSTTLTTYDDQVATHMSRARTPAQRTLDAEVRAVEEGHQARLLGDGLHFKVTSEALPNVSYLVGAKASGDLVIFTCDHPRYDRKTLEYNQYKPEWRNVVPCKHGARCARRLEREGLVRWSNELEGAWVITEKAKALLPPPPEQPDDPFEGLPGC